MLVGRARERQGIGDALRRTRLVTLAGPGGVGKTRLALELPMRSSPGGATGCGSWISRWVRRPRTSRPTRHGCSTSATRAAPARRMRCGSLTTRDLLLVLDNCEHVVDACAQLAAALLASCPSVRALATSRDPRNLLAEVQELALELDEPELEGWAYLFQRPDRDARRLGTRSVPRASGHRRRVHSRRSGGADVALPQGRRPPASVPRLDAAPRCADRPGGHDRPPRPGGRSQARGRGVRHASPRGRAVRAVLPSPRGAPPGGGGGRARRRGGAAVDPGSAAQRRRRDRPGLRNQAAARGRGGRVDRP